jgi:hypothetical protein
MVDGKRAPGGGGFPTKVILTVELSNRRVQEADLLEAYIEDALANFNTHTLAVAKVCSVHLPGRRSQRARLERQGCSREFISMLQSTRRCFQEAKRTAVEHGPQTAMCPGIPRATARSAECRRAILISQGRAHDRLY